MTASNIPNNDIGLDGIEFIEFAANDPSSLHKLFLEFGFSRTKQACNGKIDYYEQGEIRFLLNKDPKSAGYRFSNLHGPSICSMGWRFKRADQSFELATKRGAVACNAGDYLFQKTNKNVPAIFGIGESLIYFLEDHKNTNIYSNLGFENLPNPDLVESKGFTAIDHLTNNVPMGQMGRWADFYKQVFGFTEVRYFDIRGEKTGLQSYALKSPCGKFCIPINEAGEEKSQINEYIREYNGPGIQHLAFLTSDILGSLQKLSNTSIKMLDIDDEYYEEVFKRLPGITEDRLALRKHNVLVDGDSNGYLLQIFTKNIIGPIFIEIIQRKNHQSFGEGNFKALFRSIERDQMKRGIFEDNGKQVKD